MDALYANRFSIALSPTEAFITFAQLVPEHDDEGKVVGDRITEQRGIIMSLSGAETLNQMLNELLSQKKADEENSGD